MFLLAAVEVNPYLNIVLDNLVSLIVLVVVVLAAVFSARIIDFVETKFGIDIDDKYEAKIQEMVKSGVLRAGEWARAQTKASSTPDSAAKLAAAVEYVKSELVRQGYEDMAEEQIKALAEAMLAKLRVEQVRATDPKHLPTDLT